MERRKDHVNIDIPDSYVCIFWKYDYISNKADLGICEDLPWTYLLTDYSDSYCFCRIHLFISFFPDIWRNRNAYRKSYKKLST